RAWIAREARGVYAGRAVERVDADAGIVRQRRKPRERTRVPCLDERILDERRVGLVDLGHAELRLGNHLDAERLEEPPELAKLARVAGGRREPLDHDSSALRCARNSSPMPECASPSRVSNSPRVNGAPSAVPCNSTKPPRPVMTMFMSVAQAASSV